VYRLRLRFKRLDSSVGLRLPTTDLVTDVPHVKRTFLPWLEARVNDAIELNYSTECLAV
jgi:hypothetical protein